MFGQASIVKMRRISKYARRHGVRLLANQRPDCFKIFKSEEVRCPA